MGTARMGDDPKASVVNSFGQAHDVKNLFVVDGSIFVSARQPEPDVDNSRALDALHDLSDRGAQEGQCLIPTT